MSIRPALAAHAEALKAEECAENGNMLQAVLHHHHAAGE